MRVPESLVPLFDYGVLDDVVRPLMSGKEAHVYLVVSGGKYAVAKIYKDAENRSFKHRAEYTEGRKVRNTRDQRAMANRSKHGRAKDEAAWRSTEVDMIHRLHAAGVRVPVPYHFIESVLLMELVVDADGNPAPRLGDLAFDAVSARAMYNRLIGATVQMLCAGVVHGDLSEFNVLIAGDGPVVIDFPQSIDSAHNTNARKLLIRDVDNLHRFLERHDPSWRRVPLAEEMWALHEQNALTPDTRLRGDFRVVERKANTASVLELIGDANRDERKRREGLGLRGGPPSSPEPSRGSSGSSGMRGGAAKKEVPVYQGLKDEGLKFFRHLRDQPSGGGPRGGAQRGGAPRGGAQQQRPQHARGQSQSQSPSQGHGQAPPLPRWREEPAPAPRADRPQVHAPQQQRPDAHRAPADGPRRHDEGQRPQGEAQRPHPQPQRAQSEADRPHAQPRRTQSEGRRPEAHRAQSEAPRPEAHRAPSEAPRHHGQRPHVDGQRGQRPQGQQMHGDGQRREPPPPPRQPSQEQTSQRDGQRPQQRAQEQRPRDRQAHGQRPHSHAPRPEVLHSRGGGRRPGSAPAVSQAAPPATTPSNDLGGSEAPRRRRIVRSDPPRSE